MKYYINMGTMFETTVSGLVFIIEFEAHHNIYTSLN